MKEFPAVDLSRSPADLFEAATIAPVAITKHRKPRFVVMSMERYDAITEGQSTQEAHSVADMPLELGALLAKGLDEHFNGK